LNARENRNVFSLDVNVLGEFNFNFLDQKTFL